MGKYITEAERYQIEILLKEKYTIPQIAETLGHKYNTVYKEIRKGTVKQLDSDLCEHYLYKADYAQMVYEQNTSNRGRNLKIGADYEFVNYIEDMIKNKKYSPEALLLNIKNQGLQFNTTLCYKTIYNYLDMGLFLNISVKDLPVKKIVRKKKTQKSKVSLNNRTGRSIEKRPVDILNRDEFGHWEMDTVVSGQNTGKSCLLVLSERMTRQELLIKIKNKTSSSVVRALNALERKMGARSFRETFKTITCDNGVEFLDSNGIEQSRYNKTSRTILYYCHPYSSYERGTNENINRMIRRHFPKGTNFDEVNTKQINMVQDWINNYPRKILGGISSNDFLKTLIAVDTL